MAPPNTARATALVTLTLALVACSRGEPADGVIHLDPRLADGRSSADVLSGRREAHRAWPVGVDPARLRPWKLLKAEATPAPSGEGLWMRPGHESNPRRPVRLLYPGPIEADEINLVQVSIADVKQGRSTLIWLTHEDRQRGVEQSGVLRVIHPESKEALELSFFLGGDPRWRGRIARLILIPHTAARDRSHEFELRNIRLARLAFVKGAEPLQEEREGRTAGDGGLVTMSSEARRCWPGDFGVPLFARARIPAGGRLELGVAVPLAHAGHLGERGLWCTVDVRRPGGGWRSAERTWLTPVGAWRTMRVDLSRWGGEEVELRLAASTGPETGLLPQTELRQARVLWGSPLILGERPPDRRPSVLLLTLDTLRADALGCTGGAHTPFLDSLAERGILFENAWANANSTSPSHASILTGRWVHEHGLLNNFSKLAPENATLAELFRDAGYQTLAVVSVPHLSAGQSGLGQGFDRFQQGTAAASCNGSLTLEVMRRWAEDLTQGGDRPIFLWVHLFDPHAPYQPPESFTRSHVEASKVEVPPRVVDEGGMARTHWNEEGKFLHGANNPAYARFLYAAGAAYTDHLVGRLFGILEEAGLLGHATVAITGDHGEAFGEHGVWCDHARLYPETLRVPMILLLPSGPAGRRISATASNLDLARTLLGVAGLPPPASMRGIDLRSLAAGRAAEPRRLWMEEGLTSSVASWDGQSYFVLNRGGRARSAGKEVSFELYDWANDPELTDDLSERSPERVEELRGLFEQWQRSLATGRRIERELTPEDAASLEALGYAGDG